MDEYRRFITALMWMVIMFFMFLLVAGVSLFMLAGCTSVKYVPIESVTHDSIYISRLERDSIHVHDSIYMEVRTKSDTVYQTKYVQKVVYRDAMRTDTMVVERIDTLRIPYPVKRELSRWEQIKLDFGGMVIGGIGIFSLSSTIVWIIRRKRNNI